MLARALTVAAMLAVAGGCGSTTASPSELAPSGPPVLGIDWARAPSVERPTNFEVDSSASPYTGDHPILRIPGQAMIADVTPLQARGFVAVGYVPPDWTPAAWTSPDGLNWSIHSMGTTGFTFPVSVAAGADGTVVAVGRSGNLPVAWTSTDGVAWQEHPVPLLEGSDVAERMTTVVATARGYFAGGSVGPELFDRHARFWTSVDGVNWKSVADDPVAFANAEVRAITSFGDGFVAVGVVGTAQHPSARSRGHRPTARRGLGSMIRRSLMASRSPWCRRPSEVSLPLALTSLDTKRPPGRPLTVVIGQGPQMSPRVSIRAASRG